MAIPVTAAVTPNRGAKVAVQTKIEVPKLAFCATSGDRRKYQIHAPPTSQRIIAMRTICHWLAVRSLATILNHGATAGTVAIAMYVRWGLRHICSEILPIDARQREETCRGSLLRETESA